MMENRTKLKAFLEAAIDLRDGLVSLIGKSDGDAPERYAGIERLATLLDPGMVDARASLPDPSHPLIAQVVATGRHLLGAAVRAAKRQEDTGNHLLFKADYDDWAAALLRFNNAIADARPLIDSVPTGSADSVAWFSSTDLAKTHGVPADALYQRLRRAREKGTLEDADWMETANPRPGEPRILYRVAAAMPSIIALRSVGTP